MNINSGYIRLLLSLKEFGDDIVTRGAAVKSMFGYEFGEVRFPIVTLRKTAWKTALKELEWFMSGSETCPEGVLSDVWWKGQLNPENGLMWGYPSQLRCSPYPNGGYFDQIEWLKDEIKNHPSSRRLILSTWNPGSMAFFTDYNKNPMTPTPCHLVMNQFQVRGGRLHMNAIFRSTDAVLGLPHNLVQHRALQLYFAHHAGVKAADYYNLYLNDVHYYEHQDHNDYVDWLASRPNEYLDNHIYESNSSENDLVYFPTSDDFKAGDFHLTHTLLDPIYTKKIERTL